MATSGRTSADKVVIRRFLGGIGAFALLVAPVSAHADCALNAKSKTSYQILDRQTLLLRGGLGHDILIKVPCCVTGASSIMVLKDNFCSYENAVLYIDGAVVDVMDVRNL